jgi:hypothetical protein
MNRKRYLKTLRLLCYFLVCESSTLSATFNINLVRGHSNTTTARLKLEHLTLRPFDLVVAFTIYLLYIGRLSASFLTFYLDAKKPNWPNSEKSVHEISLLQCLIWLFSYFVNFGYVRSVQKRERREFESF